MAPEHANTTGPDLARGIGIADLADGNKLVGHCGDAQVLLVRRGAVIFTMTRIARTQRAARSGRRRHCPLPMASRKFRLENR